MTLDKSKFHRLKFLSALALPELSLSEVVSGVRDGRFCPEPVPRVFKRSGPFFLDNPNDVSGFNVLGDVTVTGLPPFLASARDATVIGYRSVITKDGIIFNDDSVGGDRLENFMRRLGTHTDSLLNEDTDLVNGSVLGEYELQASNHETVTLEGTIISLCSLEPSNYGSFIFRLLPKIYSIRRWGLIDNPVLMYRSSDTVLECLALAGLDVKNIIHHQPRFRYSCDHIIVPSMRSNDGFLDDQALDLIGELRERYGKKQVPGRRIYVSRLKYNKTHASPRQMLNEVELVKTLSSIGFDIISPESLSMRQQIEAFSSAEMVVGPAGSGMFNSVFCWPGTKLIDIESEQWWLHAHMSLFSSSKLNFGVFVGLADPTDTSPAHKRWTVDIDALLSRIHRFDD